MLGYQLPTFDMEKKVKTVREDDVVQSGTRLNRMCGERAEKSRAALSVI
jgi:hypothetical protein